MLKIERNIDIEKNLIYLSPKTINFRK